MGHRETFLSLLEDYKKRFPEDVRYCPRLQKNIPLKKFHKLKCWECENFILKHNPQSVCDPL